MSRQYRKDYISKNGNNYYLQFHIADWMRQLPAFRQYPASKKNYKRTLGTTDPHVAARKAEAILLDLNIKQKPLPEPLEQGADAYFGVLANIKTRTDKDLLTLHEQYSEMFDISLGPATTVDDWSEPDAPDWYDHSHNALAAVEREMKRRKIGRFFDEPHPHTITLLYASEKFMKDMEGEGKPKKTQSKVINAAKRFLTFRELPDMELKRISQKLVSDYVKQARLENRSENTFKNDIHYLACVFRWANQEGYLENMNNPFRDVRIIGLKKKNSKLPFTNEILNELISEETVTNDSDLSQLVGVSYYTGMRISEVYTSKFVTVDDVLCFDVASEGGKTDAAPRIIPLHNELKVKLASRYKFADGERLDWKSPNAVALGKRFGRIKNQIVERLGRGLDTANYGHHSFRHGFITALLQAGFTEPEITDLTGHKKSNIGRTEAGKTYFARQSVGKLKSMIDLAID